MNRALLDRLFNWARTFKPYLKKWWLWMLAFCLDFAYRVFEHRILANVNEAIDVHSAPYLQELKPRLLQALMHPVAIEVMVLLAIFGFLGVHAYFNTLPSQTDLPKAVPDVPIAFGLTLDSAEVETVPDSSTLSFKFKLRVYWTNDGGEIIHLGRPLWTPGKVGIHGSQPTGSYQLRKNQTAWGDETAETDIAPGQRCRIWLGLDPAFRDEAKRLLDAGELGLLIIPVNTANWSLDLCIRPRDRGLTTFNAQEHVAQHKAVTDRFVLLGHGAKEALRILLLMRLMAAQTITEHLARWEFPTAERIFDDLRNDSVPFVVSAGRSEFQINPMLERIIKEVSAKDQNEFLKLWAEMPTDQMRNRIDNDPGFAARYNAIAASMQRLS